ncbi:Ig-like domain-containing protein [Cellulomonas sp. ACRRI]|uniref:Ig-like domain-containing protein n=1 Tax=Cellulomonas sp. ACRRI TaxID=2918188 RepID=UPI001EF3337F|nr:Ig-like domain-containing protein [Cellulomonas sp. ACRRI]MCG7286863.1 Ig-like domain-containing protein [Cellulomonas sp. ACRRI]
MRALALALVAAAGIAVGGVASPGRAAAAPADDCASPTRTVAGEGWAAVTVRPGEVVRVTGRVAGGVDALPAGGTLCVAPGAVLAPAYLNAPAGTLHVAAGGTAQLPWMSTGQGFVLDAAGTVTVAGLNVNGPATLRTAPEGSLTVASAFAPSAGALVNEGRLDLPAGLTLNRAATLTSTGELVVGGPVVVDGTLDTTGSARLAGTLTVNGSGTLRNGCVLEAAGLDLSGGSATNTGLVAVDGDARTTGTWRQSSTGALTARDLLDDGTITGFGRYAFTGTTTVHGRFTGDSAAAPVLVDLPGAGFDLVTGTVANVTVTDLTIPAAGSYPAPDCAGAAAAAPSADVQLAVTGPAVVDPGAAVTYTVTVTNAGPDEAGDVRVTQTLPAAPQGVLSAVTADQGGTVAAGEVRWALGALAPGATRTLTVTGTAPASGYLVTTARAGSSTPDPDPSNNDGTALSERVGTEIATAPVRAPGPSTAPVLLEGVGGVPVLGALPATPGDPDLQLRYAITSPAGVAAVALTPAGLFAYLTPPDFAGTDTFGFRVCDNQTPEECTDATVTVVLHPRAADDAATTTAGTPVAVPVTANDSGGSRLSAALGTPPADGTAVADPAAGTVTYTPASGFTGTDTFTYGACASADPTDCTTATVRVQVLAVNRPPQAFLADLETTVDVPVAGPVVVTDPDGDPITVTAVFAPVLGSAALDPAGTRYVPPPGFAGRDLYAYTACDDGEPALCSTGLVTALVAPVATDDVVATAGGTAVRATVLDNDRGTVLPPRVVTGPAHGTVVVDGAALVYTPAAGYAGTDELVYEICAEDGSDACATARVSVTVSAAVGGPTGPSGPGGAGSGAGGTAATPADPDDGARADRLARTGTDAPGAGLLAGALVLAGTGLLLHSRRPTGPAGLRPK